MTKQNGKKAYDFAMRGVGIVKNGGSYYSNDSGYRGIQQGATSLPLPFLHPHMEDKFITHKS